MKIVRIGPQIYSLKRQIESAQLECAALSAESECAPSSQQKAEIARRLGCALEQLHVSERQLEVLEWQERASLFGGSAKCAAQPQGPYRQRMEDQDSSA